MTSALRAPAPEAPYRIHRYPSMLIDRITLADARVVTVRPVLPQDADAEQSFVIALSPQSRQRRFHGTLKQLPERTLQAMTAIDYRDHVALVAESADEQGESRLVADARCVVSAPGRAEFAIAVADDWQHIGLGRAMLQRLAHHACRQGIRHIDGAVIAGNAPMLALMRRWGAELRTDPDDHRLVITTLRCG